MADRESLIEVWRQRTIPVLFRRGGGEPLMAKLPFASDNREWLRDGKRSRPEWDPKFKCWLLPNSWFDDLVERGLSRYGKLYIIQPYRRQEKCAPACWNAKGHVCQCSCMGANHGAHHPGAGWFVVSETFAARWENAEMACRLLKKKPECAQV